MDEMIDKLVFVSKDNLTYIAEFERCARLFLHLQATFQCILHVQSSYQWSAVP